MFGVDVLVYTFVMFVVLLQVSVEHTKLEYTVQQDALV
jgi:hypothetical protein